MFLFSSSSFFIFHKYILFYLSMYKHLFIKPQMMQLLWKTVCCFLRNFNMELPLWPSNSTPGCIPWRIENISYTHTHNVCMNIYSSIIHNSKCSSAGDESQNAICPYHGILLNCKKQGCTDTCYDVSGPSLKTLCSVKKASHKGLHIVWLYLY